MAKREENLKKINEGLEKLSDEELEVQIKRRIRNKCGKQS